MKLERLDAAHCMHLNRNKIASADVTHSPNVEDDLPVNIVSQQRLYVEDKATLSVERSSCVGQILTTEKPSCVGVRDQEQLGLILECESSCEERLVNYRRPSSQTRSDEVNVVHNSSSVVLDDHQYTRNEPKVSKQFISLHEK